MRYLKAALIGMLAGLLATVVTAVSVRIGYGRLVHGLPIAFVIGFAIAFASSVCRHGPTS